MRLEKKQKIKYLPLSSSSPPFSSELIKQNRVLAEHHIGLVARRPGHIGAVCADVNLREAAAFAATKVRQACVEAYGVCPDVRISAGGGGGGAGGRGGSSSSRRSSSSSSSGGSSSSSSSGGGGGGGGGDLFGGPGSRSSGSSSFGSSGPPPPLSDFEDFDDDNSSGDPSMPYIPAHLDYCLFELLKNAARATVESAKAKAGGAGQQRTLVLSAHGVTMPSSSSSTSSMFGPLPPIVVRICDAPGKAATFRISDQGGGIPEEQQEAVWRYGFTTAAGGEEAVSSSRSSSSSSPSSSSVVAPSSMMDAMMMADGGGGGGGGSPSASPNPASSRWRMGGLGFGLPLSRLYARYFGGDLKLFSLPGFGVDAFLTLEHLAGDWIEPGDEHVPVRPSAAPRGKGGGNGGGNGGVKK